MSPSIVFTSWCQKFQRLCKDYERFFFLSRYAWRMEFFSQNLHLIGRGNETQKKEKKKRKKLR